MSAPFFPFSFPAHADASEFLQSFHLIHAFKTYILSISYLFLAMLCLCSVCGLSLIVARVGYSLVGVHELLVALICRAWVLGLPGFSSCGARGSLPRSMWNLPGPGIKPVSLALRGGFLATEPPGKSETFL